MEQTKQEWEQRFEVFKKKQTEFLNESYANKTTYFNNWEDFIRTEIEAAEKRGEDRMIAVSKLPPTMEDAFSAGRASALEEVRKIVGELPENWEQERWKYGNELRGAYDFQQRILIALSALTNTTKE